MRFQSLRDAFGYVSYRISKKLPSPEMRKLQFNLFARQVVPAMGMAVATQIAIVQTTHQPLLALAAGFAVYFAAPRIIKHSQRLYYRIKN